jgi:dolichyl-phosphate-mannose--protein O-mannosyl transferase
MDYDNQKDHARVTCGSAVKLQHVATNYRLHSHEVNYGSGSGQQSITGFQAADDPNSLFLVLAPHGSTTPCTRGTPVACDSVVRLRHVQTKKYLHTHKEHQSPLSMQQEVSGYAGADDGDNWKVKCTTGSAKHWMRDEPVELYHVATAKYLYMASQYTYRYVPLHQALFMCFVIHNFFYEW